MTLTLRPCFSFFFCGCLNDLNKYVTNTSLKVTWHWLCYTTDVNMTAGHAVTEVVLTFLTFFQGL